MELLIIRHGKPDYKNDCLTEEGKREASLLASFLKSSPPDLLYSSTMGRAKETMAYSEECFGLTGEHRDWMRELEHWRLPDRSWPWTLGMDYYRDRDWRSIPDFIAIGAEAKYEVLKKESDFFLRDLGYPREGERYLCAEPSDKRVAVFCHGGFGMAWIALLLSLPLHMAWGRFYLGTSSVSTIRFEGETGTLTDPACTGLGELGHLKGERL